MTFLITWSISDPPFSKKRQYLLGAVFIKVSVLIIYVFFHLVCHKTATKDIVIFTCHTTWATTCPRLTLLFRILAGLQVPHLTLPGIGIYFWERYVASLCINFSYVIYSRYFLKKSKMEMDRIPDVVHIVSTFSLVAGPLCNKKIRDQLINSAGFMAIVNLMNAATLD